MTEKQAIFQGVFTIPSETILPAPPQCPSANCNWPTYGSLGICSELANLTAKGNETVLSNLRQTTGYKLAAAFNSPAVLEDPSSYRNKWNESFPLSYPIVIQSIPDPSYVLNDTIRGTVASSHFIAYSDTLVSPSASPDVRTFKFLQLNLFWCTKAFSTEIKDGNHSTLETGSSIEVLQPSPWGLNMAWSIDFIACYNTGSCGKLINGRRAVLMAPPGTKAPATYEVEIWSGLAASAYLTQTLSEVFFLDHNRGAISLGGSSGVAAAAFGVALIGNMFDAAAPPLEKQLEDVQGIAKNIAASLTNL